MPKTFVCLDEFIRYKDDATYSEALEICSYEGARLCTIKELQELCTINTGCGYDNMLVWTNDMKGKQNTPSASPTKRESTPSDPILPSSIPSTSPSSSKNSTINPSMNP